MCAIGVYLSYKSHCVNRKSWVWILGAVAVVFNPIVPVHMHRSDWAIFNIIAAGIFILWIGASMVREN